MGTKHTLSSSYVKKETMLVAVIVSLAVGFLGGMVFNIYQTTAGQGRLSPQATTGDNSARIAELRQETVVHPENAQVWIQLGNAYFDTDVPSEAIQAYEKALQLNPENADVRTDLGIMYRRVGNPAKAIEAFDRAVQTDPRHETALLDKGIVLLYDLKDREGAVRAWEKLIQINPFAKTPNGRPVVDMIKSLKSGGQG